MATPTPPPSPPLPPSPSPSTGATNDEAALTFFKAHDLATLLPLCLEDFNLLDEVAEPGPTFHKFPYLPAELRKYRQVKGSRRRYRTPCSAPRPSTFFETAETLADPLSFCSIGEEVYRYYFEDAALAPKGQPQDRHQTALLLVSREIHDEARPIMFKSATLTLHVSRDIANQPLVPLANYLEKGSKYSDVCLTPAETLRRFNKVRAPRCYVSLLSCHAR